MTAVGSTDYQGPQLRAPRGAMHRLLTAAFATGLLERPAQWLVTDVYLRLSRLWAAADGAGGDPAAFLAAIPLPTRPNEQGLRRRLSAFESARAAALEADARWADAFFNADGPKEGLAAVENARLDRWRAFMNRRWSFLPMLLAHRVPKVRFAIPGPAETEAVYGPMREAPWRPFLPPDPLPSVEESRRVATSLGTMSWLRFPAPSARIGDTVWARVHEPQAAGAGVPTLIFGNGTFVEFDHMPHLTRDLAILVRLGIRVIELEAPWHGRRRPAGSYGGELFLARAPLSGLDLMSAMVQETAVLTAWCRARGDGRVGVGGISMGALAARTLAVHAGRWPEGLRPDVLVLITFCDRLELLPFDSLLAKCTGLDRAIAAAGWARSDAERMRPFTEPAGGLAVPAERIVAVLGKADKVTPVAWGERALAAMGVPEANVFRRRGGHLSASMGLARAAGPWRRIGEVLTG